MHKFVKVALGAVVGAIAGAASVPFYLLCDATAPVAYPVLGTVLGGVQGAQFDKPVHGAAVGLVFGASMVPLASFNASNRWWFQPLVGAATGVGVGIACSR